ncbi:MAG: helix-hairpin-helix domain-containing protein [Chloroflexi bacterium]|nr:helix-hairpin-helix domain-containing protein [Chloroflexota bacterium]
MDTVDKLQALGTAAQFDVCGYCGGRTIPPSPDFPWRFIHRAALPGGGSVSLMKVLLTNACVNDCAYCVNQVGRDGPRYSFRPEELAKLFTTLYERRQVQGLFLSSAIAGSPSRTMESMIDTVAILRQRYRFPGYIHLKVLPGATFDCVAEACKMASRVSVNIEAPTAQHLARLSSGKDLATGILEPMRWVKKIVSSDEALVPAGQTTQFVVGAARETDQEIWHATQALYQEMGLRRVYFSAFHPVAGSRLEGPPTPPMRQHRLYQMDWLLRVYRFDPPELELALGKEGNLPLAKDPKLVIAQRQPWLFPADVNRASYEELLRVPGIGPVGAGRIVEARRDHSIDSLEQLKKMRVLTRRAVPFLWFQGMPASERQTSFLPQLESGTPAPEHVFLARVAS